MTDCTGTNPAYPLPTKTNDHEPLIWICLVKSPSVLTEDCAERVGQCCWLVHRYETDEARVGQRLCAFVKFRAVQSVGEGVGGPSGTGDDNDPPTGLHAAFNVVVGDLTAVDEHGDRRRATCENRSRVSDPGCLRPPFITRHDQEVRMVGLERSTIRRGWSARPLDSAGGRHAYQRKGCPMRRTGLAAQPHDSG